MDNWFLEVLGAVDSETVGGDGASPQQTAYIAPESGAPVRGGSTGNFLVSGGGSSSTTLWVVGGIVLGLVLAKALRKKGR